MAAELRTAREDDRDAVCRVFAAARRAALAYLPVLHSAEEDRGHFGRLIAGGGVTVAVVDGVVVGFLALGEAHVDHLYVAPGRWREGIGTQLLRHAQAASPGGFDLWVFQRNTAAIAFYERHGMRTVEMTAGDGNEEREPDARMVWPDA